VLLLNIEHEMAPLTEEMRSGMLPWYGHFMQNNENHISIKRIMCENVDGHPSRGRPKIRWKNCVKDMRLKRGR
jgi:hypothetical protein